MLFIRWWTQQHGCAFASIHAIYSVILCYGEITLSYLSDKKIFTLDQAKAIGEQLGISWDKFDLEEFRAGLAVELEHGTVYQTSNVTNDDPLVTGKIALAHLTEFPDYYTRLAKMEEEAKNFWDSKKS